MQAGANSEDDEEHSLWVAYRATQSVTSREQLLARYDPLVSSIAARMYRARGDQAVAFADCLQYGRVGLMEALERFDLSRSIPFPGFASQRIRGAILNGIARETEFAAQRAFWRSRSKDRLDSIRTAVAPDADRASLADIVTITMGLAVGVILEGLESGHEPADVSLRTDPYAINEVRQLNAAVRELLDRLPDNERTIMKGHYIDALEFQLLAERLALTKGRVSQLHAQALTRLRSWLEQRPTFDRKL